MSKPLRTNGQISFGTRCALLSLFAVLFLASAMFTVKGLAAAGFTGTPGTFTVKECAQHRDTGSRHSTTSSPAYDCTGHFRSEDGKSVNNDASMSGLDTRYSAGIRLPSQKDTGKSAFGFLIPDYALTSRGEITKNFMCAFGFLLFAPFLLYSWLTGAAETGGTVRQARERWRATAGTRTRTIVLTTGGVILFGVLVVSPVLGFVLAP
ncbi:hypothetical protein [Streptomyces lydicus]|uniref:hypothetical protein n=1 Tax=Streptomyces lydicus TaxID=47763 RepID=UPI0010139EB9|nr:hypothetical protein [Streptomyces lydicus]MCZ1007433.1 hypothetical protein [Streptomyces lydicus]